MIFYWVIGSFVLFLLNVFYAVYYFVQTHFLVRATIAFPKINAEIGSPRSIMDISIRHNCDCYKAFQLFCTNERYLDDDMPESLASRFSRLEKTKRKGMRFTLITITNFMVCFSTLLILSN